MNRTAANIAGVPLHEVVRAEILKKIASGEYKPGDAIMSTARLGEEFGVSSITVKRALRDLQSAGYLTSIPGKGTFVKERRRFVRELMDVCMSSFDDAKRHGFEPQIEFVSLTKEKINDPTLAELGAPDTALLCVRKVISVEDVPIMFDSTFVPANVPDKVVDEFGERFIVDTLRSHNKEIKDISLIVDAAPASPEAQQVFGIPNGYPTLRRLYHIKTRAPSWSIFGVVESPFDKVACSVKLVDVSADSLRTQRKS